FLLTCWTTGSSMRDGLATVLTSGWTVQYSGSPRSQRQGANSDLPGSPRPQRPLERLKVPVLEARACDSGVRACPVHVLAIIPETEVTPVLVRSWGQQERVG
ncbi:hypothetical protein BaRGS_00010374, partial [Batillaria attramentaria]